MDQEIIDLYDQYTHALLDRRVFLARLAELAGGAAAAAALVPQLAANPAHATLTTPGDDRLEAGRTTCPGAPGELALYLARPKGAAPTQAAARLPAVIVIHENRGLNAHIEDVTRRLALAGFLAAAPDLLSPAGGTPADEDAAREMIGKLDAAGTARQLQALLQFLEKDPRSTGRVGAVGFCWGGGMVGDLAVQAPGLDAGVVYYGRQPAATDVGRIKAPLLLHYAGLDKRIGEGIPAFEEALKKAKKKYTLHLYEGVNHAFNNDTSEARYDKAAADLAWERTIAFLRASLKA